MLDTLDSLIGAPVGRSVVGRQLGDARDTAADIARARRDLGFEPPYQFESGLRAQLEWRRTAVAGRETVLRA